MKIAHRRGDRWDGLLLVVAGYSVVYFTAPDDMSGGGMISLRMNLYPFFALMLWCGAQSYHRMVKRGIQIVAVGIALALLGLHVQKYAELNEYLGSTAMSYNCSSGSSGSTCHWLIRICPGLKNLLQFIMGLLS